ncbi:MAG: VWA domain-containing protein [Nitrospirae bacterium]|nr:VWA domain-containing protein [Nitrospirota bacterium]
MDKDSRIVDNIFRQARKDLYYPPIVKVEMADVQTGKIDLLSRGYRILVGRDIVKKLSQKALLGLFHHELNHWAKHPYDAKIVILEDHFLGGMPDKDAIRNFYDDIVVNLDLIVNKGLRDVAVTYQELLARARIDRLLRAFYQEVTGIDFGEVGLESELSERLAKLSEIDFLNTSRDRIKANIRRFAVIVWDLVDEETFLPFCFFSLRDFGPVEIEKAMRYIAKELDPKEYREISGKVLNVIKETGVGHSRKSLLKDLEKPDISWYKTMAQRYAIYIEAFSKRGSLYPHELKDFELDDNLDTYSPIESLGKILPGLAKRYNMEEFEGYGELSLPDALIIIDSSGSMRDPDKDISYAVLGAFSIARNYLEHGSIVGVINFSDSNLELEPTWERDEVYRMLKMYQGGGTTLHLGQLGKFLAKVVNREKIDYIMITDAGIDNIISVVDYLSKLKGRITIIWIKSDVKGYERFENAYKLLKKGLSSSVTFVEIEDEKDIPHIIVGKSFSAYAEH